MINRLARRLGFQQSVPVALIESWHLPAPTKPVIELAPREGVAACHIDEFGRLQVSEASYTIDFTLAAGARWVAFSEAERVKQQFISPGVLQTTVETPSGPIVQRVAAGVVDGEPVAIVEIENTGGVAIAVGAVVRPTRLDGRGFIGEVEIDAAGIAVDGEAVIRFTSAPATVAAQDGASGDLLLALPDADVANAEAKSRCRSGGAQAAAVWPLPHTATLRLVVHLRGATSAAAAVPTTDDIARGWQAHLKQGLQVEVDELDVGADLAQAAQSVLTLWPNTRDDTPLVVTALAELGFGRDAGRLFDDLERCEDDDAVVRSLARWAQLGEQTHQLEDLDRALGRLARAAHVIANRGGELPGQGWLNDALVVLGGRLHQIDQPDVAERVQGFRAHSQSENAVDGVADRLAALDKARDKRGVWPEGHMRAAATYVRAVRALIVDDRGDELRLLPDMPKLWRGRPIDVFGLPVANGNISFGLRWHGPRPALLWEASLAPEAPLTIRVPGIDSEFSTNDRAGETLLADPGWQTT